jgi:hypothetical protein
MSKRKEVFAPHLTDPDPPMKLMSAAESAAAAAKIAEMFPELVMKSPVTTLPGRRK